ncbi:MATE family efflux transporter [Flammeovirga agarivorans]|uniref:Multidrug-efflux transporter n=1 Tax=Flammeovirga agarivorans TaxID=2726742 RepID=A0A7X8SGI1_9BACT|nr:MATE family efflux transporter [Flammeovirga agarivorans]NLR89829.1 MATE family efflux transporter [Flammeovirga agarivorans]
MKKDLTTGPVKDSIVGLVIPIVSSSLLLFAYNFADILWVGQLGSDAIAAVGTMAIFLSFCWAIISVFLFGSNIIVSLSIGKQNNKQAQELAQQAFIGVVGLTAIIQILIFWQHENIISFFQLNNPVVEKMAKAYLIWSGVEMIFSFMIQQMTSVSNARGDAKTPLKINLIGVGLNIILDPIFMFGFDLGVEGAAIATFISRFIAFVLFWRRSSVEFYGCKCVWIFNLKDYINVLKIGFPPSIQRVMFTLVGIFMARIVAHWGAEAIAAQKIGLQIESMTFMLVNGLSGAMLSFTGQNFGAQKFERIQKGYISTVQFGSIFGVVMGAVFFLFPEFFVKWFLSDPKAVNIAVSYLQIIGISQFLMCIEMITTGVVNGLGKTEIPAAINVVFTVIRVPMAYLFAYTLDFGINGVWLSIAISTFLRAIAITIAYVLIKKKIFISEKKSLQTVSF